MSFSKKWEAQFADSNHLSIWPWSDVVSYVMRYCRPVTGDFKVLEIGCGAGANIPFFLSLGVDYTGVDGSESAIKLVRDNYPEISDKLHVMDFTKSLPYEEFDLVLDRASVTHNSTENIENFIRLLTPRLKNNGVFIGIDWFSDLYSDYANNIGEIGDDKYTMFFDSKSRRFSNLGNVHFSSKEHIYDLFSAFKIEHMQLKQISDLTSDNVEWNFASWNFIATLK